MHHLKRFNQVFKFTEFEKNEIMDIFKDFAENSDIYEWRSGGPLTPIHSSHGGSTWRISTTQYIIGRRSRSVVNQEGVYESIGFFIDVHKNVSQEKFSQIVEDVKILKNRIDKFMGQKSCVIMIIEGIEYHANLEHEKGPGHRSIALHISNQICVEDYYKTREHNSSSSTKFIY